MHPSASVRRQVVGALSAMIVAACTVGPTGPAVTGSAASVPALSTPGGTTAAPPSSLVGGGGVSVGSILGGDYAPPPGTTWTRVSDPGAPFAYEAPTSWAAHAAYPWKQGETAIGTALAAGPDLARLSTDFSVPGIVVGIGGNPAGLTPRQAVEGDDFSSVCTATPIQEASQDGGTAAYQLWQSCGGGTGILLVMVFASGGSQSLLGIVFQGTSAQDLGYLDHIVKSIGVTAGPAATAAPAASGGAVSGPTYTISMDTCQNQHGQGVSGGLIRNDDTLVHTYRIVVAFSDPNGVFLNDTGWTTSDLPPGVTATWQATVPSGLPAVSVSCQVTRVELVR